jgi:hypothetical protein
MLTSGRKFLAQNGQKLADFWRPGCQDFVAGLFHHPARTSTISEYFFLGV